MVKKNKKLDTRDSKNLGATKSKTAPTRRTGKDFVGKKKSEEVCEIFEVKGAEAEIGARVMHENGYMIQARADQYQKGVGLFDGLTLLMQRGLLCLLSGGRRLVVDLDAK